MSNEKQETQVEERPANNGTFTLTFDIKLAVNGVQVHSTNSTATFPIVRGDGTPLLDVIFLDKVMHNQVLSLAMVAHNHIPVN